MYKLLSSSDYRTMPWKNGQGVTEQMAIHPADAIFPKDRFLWRLSSARIHSRNSFSLFPGFDRVLTVWQGEGLFLNGTKLPAMTPYAFSGDDKIDCEIQGKEVIDVGLIYRRDLFTAEMTVRDFLKTEKMSAGNETQFFFVADGEIFFQNQKAETGDTFWFQEESIEIVPSGKCRCLQITLRQR